jgi:hypothetical protein
MSHAISLKLQMLRLAYWRGRADALRELGTPATYVKPKPRAFTPAELDLST